MLKFLITTCLVLASVLAQGHPSSEYSDHSHFIDNVEGNLQGRRALSQPQNSQSEKTVQIDSKILKQLCSGRRAMPDPWNYPDSPVYGYPVPTTWGPAHPVRDDLTNIPFQTIQIGNTEPGNPEDFHGAFPSYRSIKNDNTAGPVFKIPPKSNKPKTQNKEAYDHSLPVEEVESSVIIPTERPVNDERLGNAFEPKHHYPSEVKIFYPKEPKISQLDLRNKAHSSPTPILKDSGEDGQEFVHDGPINKPTVPKQSSNATKHIQIATKPVPSLEEVGEDGHEFVHDGPINPRVQKQSSDSKKQIPYKISMKRKPECVTIDKSAEIDDVIPNSRRSMGDTPDDSIGYRPVLSKVPLAILESVRDENRNADDRSSFEDQTNRYTYPTNLVSYSPSSAPSVYPSPTPIVGIHNIQPSDPTKGVGILPLRSSLGMIQSTRICYACTSLSDVSCWMPNRGTTVKYCRPGHHSCITKTIKSTKKGGDLIVVRDCGNSCDNSPLVDTVSCSICKEDLCNNIPVDSGALSFNPVNTLIVVIITSAAKLAF